MVSGRMIADHVALAARYVRSADLRRDLDDPEALEGYVVTATVREAVQRVARGLRPGSRQRAFRITGPYGVGKSSVALLLARLFRGNADALALVEACLPAGAALPRYEPVVLTGRRASFVDDLLDALEAAAQQFGAAPIVEIVGAARSGRDKAAQALAALETLAAYLQAERDCGLLLFVDEMGRYLEFAASHPRLEDPSVFQALAERASGGGENPLAVIALLHHRFSDYVAGLGEWIEAEWSKTAERYEEVSFRESVELSMISDSLVSGLASSISRITTRPWSL